MTSLEQAIRDAVEKGGYAVKYANADGLPDMYARDGYEIIAEQILLDPAFWQALGKARGWGMFGEFDNDYRKIKYEEWLHNWHRLIDHLASGKDVESFFATL